MSKKAPESNSVTPAKASPPLVLVVTLIVNPILIMLMVSSLVFFLVEVLYQGQYSGRLNWSLGFFCIGAVLIARITIEQGRALAGIYAVALGAACLLAMMAFVSYPAGWLKVLAPVLNLGLMGLVWFAADRLTWDCTHMDDARKASGQGVLAAAGLDDARSQLQQAKHPEDEDPAVGLSAKDWRQLSWWERWDAIREQRRRRPHTPGVRVLIFGLAALPLFGLGQSLIASTDGDRRSTIFWLMLLYVASSLALLVTTSLMGLARYLSERGAKVPARWLVGWLTVGGVLILMFLAIGAVLPRPHSETPLWELSRSGSQRSASRNAILRDGNAGQGDGATGQKTKQDSQANTTTNGQPGSGGEKGQGGSSGKNASQSSQSGSQSSNPKSNSSGEKSASRSSSESQPSQQGPNTKSGPSEGKSQGKSQGQSPGKSQEKSSSQKSGERDQRQSKSQDSNSSSNSRDESSESDSRDNSRDDSGKDSGEDSGDNSGSDDSGSETGQQLGEVAEKLGQAIKWVVWIVLGILLIVVAGYALLRWLAPFTHWAQNFLGWLGSFWSRRPQRAREEFAGEVAGPSGPTYPPFSEFENPFEDPARRKSPPEAIIRYTAAALQSWAAEQGQSRQPDETPQEFIVRLGHEFPSLDEPGFTTIQLWQQVLYSVRPIEPEQLNAVRELWKVMTQLAPLPRVQ